MNSYAFEKNDGSLTNPAAYVVCTKVRGLFTLGASLKPQLVTGQWVLRLKETNDKTHIDMRLANTMAVIVDGDANQTDENRTHALIVKSTGAFEKEIEQALQ